MQLKKKRVYDPESGEWLTVFDLGNHYYVFGHIVTLNEYNEIIERVSIQELDEQVN